MNRKFMVSPSGRFLRGFAKAMLWILLPSAIYGLFYTLIRLVSGSTTLSDAAISIIGSILAVYIAFSLPPRIVNEYCDICVTEAGLSVLIYAFRSEWRLIQWTDILEINKVTRPDRWGNAQWIVKIRELTYWHRLIGWQYGY
ncbi:MAG: hypothetical protein AB1649_26415, partial [Chloroflexota bacterium]